MGDLDGSCLREWFELEGTFKGPGSNPDTFHYPRLLRASSSLAWKTSRDGAATDSLGKWPANHEYRKALKAGEQVAVRVGGFVANSGETAGAAEMPAVEGEMATLGTPGCRDSTDGCRVLWRCPVSPEH